MSQNTLQFLLDEVILDYSTTLTNIQNMSKKFIQKMVDEKEKEFRPIIEAFLECIESTSEPLFLRDITAISMAEARHKQNFALFQNIFREGGAESEYHLHYEYAIHRWLLLLENAHHLKGKYNGKIGKFTPFSSQN